MTSLFTETTLLVHSSITCKHSSYGWKTVTYNRNHTVGMLQWISHVYIGAVEE